MSTVEQANWERDCVAYLRSLQNHCTECLRRYNCPMCEITTAKALLKRKDEIGMRHTMLIDKPKDPNSLKARYREILTILRKAGKPLRARARALSGRLASRISTGGMKPPTTPKEKHNENNIPPDGERQADQGDPA